MRKILLVLLLFINLIFPAFSEDNQNTEVYTSQAHGIVQKIDYDYTEKTDTPETISKQIVTVKVTTGKFKGKEKTTVNMLTGNPAYEVFLKEGDKVLLVLEAKVDDPENFDDVDIFISDAFRLNAVFLYCFIFIMLVLFVGRKKGALSLLSILITVVLVFLIFVPLVLHNISPIFAALMISVISTLVTMYLVAGINSKSNAAILGTVASLVFASCLAFLSIKIGNLSGFTGEESIFLYTQRPDLSFTGIFASAMIIAALGALMDVAISISSTINEIHLTNPKLGVKELFKSGMNVGRDIIGTMANTLILVYLGNSMPLVLLSSNIDAEKFFNLNTVAGEIISALVGSIALLACVPLTAIVSSYLVLKTPANNHAGPLNKLFADFTKGLSTLPLFKDKKDSPDEEQKTD